MHTEWPDVKHTLPKATVIVGHNKPFMMKIPGVVVIALKGRIGLIRPINGKVTGHDGTKGGCGMINEVLACRDGLLPCQMKPII